MMTQILDPKTGKFRISEEFVVSSETTIQHLIAYFGESELQIRDFKNGYSNYTIRNLKIGELYFILTFYFVKSSISKIDILVQELPYYLNNDLSSKDGSGWDNFSEKDEIEKGDFLKLWFAQQMHRDYKKYDWGKAGVNYDHHNLNTSCAITYNLKTTT